MEIIQIKNFKAAYERRRKALIKQRDEANYMLMSLITEENSFWVSNQVSDMEVIEAFIEIQRDNLKKLKDS